MLLYNPEKLGYTFLGWYTDKACKKRITKIVKHMEDGSTETETTKETVDE